jgi:hypothetical protein
MNCILCLLFLSDVDIQSLLLGFQSWNVEKLVIVFRFRLTKKKNVEKRISGYFFVPLSSFLFMYRTVIIVKTIINGSIAFEGNSGIAV